MPIVTALRGRCRRENLLRRQRDPDPWARLKPDNLIETGYYLLSLPGYRSTVVLDNANNATAFMAPTTVISPSGGTFIYKGSATGSAVSLSFSMERG